jgi:hypothetical protein
MDLETRATQYAIERVDQLKGTDMSQPFDTVLFKAMKEAWLEGYHTDDDRSANPIIDKTPTSDPDFSGKGQIP